jgi:ComF family protein
MRLPPLLWQIPGSLLSLFFPDPCAGCGEPLARGTKCLCVDCLIALPRTGHARHRNNPVERIFWGRVPIEAAFSELHFTRHSIVQSLLHEIKYRGNREAALFSGRMMGRSIRDIPPFNTIEAILPLPLHRERERHRGYNQSAVIGEGIASIMEVPLVTDLLLRHEATGTQTRKSRPERWENVRNAFQVGGQPDLEGRTVLLVDDVVTTGATLEAAAEVMIRRTGCRICIATLAYANK